MKPCLTYLFYTNTVLVILSSCQDEYTICEQNKLVQTNLRFYQKNGSLDVLTAPQQLTFGALGSGTFLYSQATGINTLDINLKPGLDDSAKYYVKTDLLAPADTLTLFYSTQIITLSAECGNLNYFQLSNIKTTLNTVDSVKIIITAVTNVTTENIKLYF